jgi:hypothetical protein
MTYRLTWSQTGDYFDVNPIDAELSAWFVDQCRIHESGFKTNVFATDRQTNTATALIEQSKLDLCAVNGLLDKFQLPLLHIDDWFDQTQLNQLHKDWIALLRNNANIEHAMFNINEQVFDAFHRINRQVHSIESLFVYEMRCPSLWREPNPFMDRTFDTGVFNVSILYVDHGRNAKEKFVNFDDEPNDHELSPWCNIGANIEINLSRPYFTQQPTEFLDYCAKHGIAAQDDRLPFGNLVDCKSNLANARQVMNRNHILADNYLIIE